MHLSCYKLTYHSAVIINNVLSSLDKVPSCNQIVVQQQNLFSIDGRFGESSFNHKWIDSDLFLSSSLLLWPPAPNLSELRQEREKISY